MPSRHPAPVIARRPGEINACLGRPGFSILQYTE